MRTIGLQAPTNVRLGVRMRPIQAIQEPLPSTNTSGQRRPRLDVEYDFFGKRPGKLSPTSTSRKTDKLDWSGDDTERGRPDNERISMSVPSTSAQSAQSSSSASSVLSGREGSVPRVTEYRVMNPMYRIMQKARDVESNARRLRDTRPISVLVLDEGGETRSRLTGAMLTYMLRSLRKPINARVTVASLGPPTSEQELSTAGLLKKMVKLWMKDDPEALAVVERKPRQFAEVQDPVENDIILVMDRYDLQEALREVSVLDAISPGHCYSSRIKMIAPFASMQKVGRRVGIKLPMEIPDPIYFNKDEEFNALSKDLALCCKGVVDMLYGIHEKVVTDRVHGNLHPRDVVQQIMRCPGIWMELPYIVPRKASKETLSLSSSSPANNKYAVRTVHGKRVIAKKNSKERGYWKNIENVERELRKWMERNQMSTVLPTQGMLRSGGAHSLASSIDFHGGLSVFATRMELKLHTRRPNGYWQNFNALRDELLAYLSESAVSALDSDRDNDSSNDKNELIMPTAQDLMKEGRSDLVRAVRLHGGFTQVALAMGINSHRSSSQWEEMGILNVLRKLKNKGKEVSRQTIREADMAGLESAIDRLGGFPYFVKLLDDDKESCQLFLTTSSVEDIWSSDTVACDQLQCPLPYIDKVANNVVVWMQTNSDIRYRLPTRQELEVNGRLDLWRSIQRAGGLQKLSEYLDIPYVETRGRKKTQRGKTAKKEDETPDLLQTWKAYEEFTLID